MIFSLLKTKVSKSTEIEAFPTEAGAVTILADKAPLPAPFDWILEADWNRKNWGRRDCRCAGFLVNRHERIEGYAAPAAAMPKQERERVKKNRRYGKKIRV